MKKKKIFLLLINILIWLIICLNWGDTYAVNIGFSYYLIGYEILGFAFSLLSTMFVFIYFNRRKRNINKI